MEKIKKMITELQAECIKEGLTLVACASLNDGGEAITAAFGKSDDLMMNVLTIAEKIDEARKDCDCPNCKARKSAKNERDGQTIDVNTLAAMTAKIMRGDNQ